jgi:hypothetical protein
VTRVKARAILLALVALMGIGWQYSEAITPPVVSPEGNASDVLLYRDIIAHLRAGDPYYVSVGNALRRYGFPTRPVFNWRTPLHLRMLAALGVRRSEWLMRALAFLAIVLAGWAFGARSTRLAVAGMISIFGAMLMPLLTYDAVLLAEIWTGIFIGLSLAAYHREKWIQGALLGVVAIFLRELAAPYVLVCGILAIVERRRREGVVWIVAGVGYAGYYLLHAATATQYIYPGDTSRQYSWVQLQGLPFVLTTLHDYGWLMLFPTSMTAVACALGLAATAAPSIPRQLKWSLLAYVVFFTVMGQRFDYYWGFVSTAIWGYAFVHSLDGLKRLARYAILERPDAPRAAAVFHVD